MKSTRTYENPTLRNAYRSPTTCDRAGVTPGLVYFAKAKAEADALLLSYENPVGFTVVELQNHRLK